MKTKDESIGRFIVIAGGDGTGKTTQGETLREKYPEALFTREPGGTEYAEAVRDMVLKSKFKADLNGYEQMTQVFSARSHHLRKVILPALKEGRNVFCDRYDCCSFAYQIFGMQQKELFGIFEPLRMSMETLTFPDLYLILDISPEEGMRRVAKRSGGGGEINYFDTKKIDFHTRVREGYRRFAEMHASRVAIIDAHQSIEKVSMDIKNALDQIFK